jgi:hypothetical protein
MAQTEIQTTEDELTALMNDLDAMLADASPKEESNEYAVASPAAAELPTTAPEAAEVPVAAVPEPEQPAALSEETPPWEESGALEGMSETVIAPLSEEVIIPEASIPPIPELGSKPVTVYATKVEKKEGLDFYIDVAQFQRDSHVSELNLDEAMMQHTGMRAFYGAQAAYAEAQAAKVKAQFEVIEASLFDKHRKALVAAGEKATEAVVDAAVKRDPMWLKAKTKVIEAQTIAEVNKGLSWALSDRRDMLIQLGADRREEFKGAVRVTQQQDANAALGDRAKSIGQRLQRG